MADCGWEGRGREDCGGGGRLREATTLGWSAPARGGPRGEPAIGVGLKEQNMIIGWGGWREENMCCDVWGLGGISIIWVPPTRNKHNMHTESKRLIVG